MLTRWRQHYLLPLCAVTISAVAIRCVVTIDYCSWCCCCCDGDYGCLVSLSGRTQNIRTESSVNIFCRQLVVKSHSQLIAAIAAAIGRCHFATFANVAFDLATSAASAHA